MKGGLLVNDDMLIHDEEVINAWVKKRLEQRSKTYDGDLRVRTSGKGTWDVFEHQNGEWVRIHQDVGQGFLCHLLRGYSCYRGGSIYDGDYHRKAPPQMVLTTCTHCGTPYQFTLHRTRQLLLRYCSPPCAIHDGMDPGEAKRQFEEEVIYLGD